MKTIRNVWLILLVIWISIVAVPTICLIYGSYLAIIWFSYLFWFVVITIIAIGVFIYHLIKK